MAGGAPLGGVKAAGPALSKRQEYFAFALVTSLFFLWGFSYSLVDVLNKKVQHSFGITKLESTMIQVAYFGAYLVFCLPASFVASRFSYRTAILMGLGLYVTGALLFWPAAKYAVFWPFPCCAFVIGCGLATLETTANSYITVLGSPERAAFRLNFAQSFNGLATFIGPTIAAHTFFKDPDSTELTSVQYVYLAVACLGAAVAVLFFFAKLPEITGDDLQDAQENAGIVDNRPLYKRKHTVLGFICQFCYVGAQVTIATFIINLLTDKGDYTSAQASSMFGYMQIVFMVSRFISTPLTRWINPSLLVAIYGAICAICSLVVATIPAGKATLAFAFLIFFGESIIYPTVFTLATSNLGKHSKRGSGLLCMGVAGGAVFPPMQGAMADAKGTTLSYIIPAIGFAVIIPYGIGMFFYGRRMAAIATGLAGVEGGAQRTESYDEKDLKESEQQVERA